MWDRFVTIINEAVEHCVPVSRNKWKCGIWMTRKAMRARKGKMRMWERYKESKITTITEYKRIMNKAMKEYRKAKRKYERALVEDIKKNPRHSTHTCDLKAKRRMSLVLLKMTIMY